MNVPLPRNLVPERGEPAPPAQADAPATLDPHRLIALLRRNLLLIGVTIGVAMALGLLISLLTVPHFVATSRIQIEQQVERVLPVQADADTPAPAQDAERFLQTQLDVLRSRSVAIGVAQQLRLFGNPRFVAAMGATGATAGSPAAREQTISLLQRGLSVDLPRNSRIVSLSFGARDPQIAADVANAFAQVFISANLQRKFSSSAYARDFLAGQLVEAKARLERSERELNGYARAAGLIAARPALGATEPGQTAQTTSQSVTTASLQQLNDALNLARAARVEAEQRWRASAGVDPLSLPDVLASGAVQTLLQQRAVLTADLRQARERYRNDYPALAEKTSQLDEINNQIGRLAGDIRASIRNRYTVAAANERALAREVAGFKEATLTEQDRSVRFTVLSREVDTNRTLYDGLLGRYKELSAAAGISSNNISVVDAAERPLKPSSPRLGFNLAVSLLLGLILAGALVLAREQIDDAVRGPADLERKLQLASLGAVPRASADLEEALGDPKSPVAEAYNALRSALLYSTADGLPRSILVTSAQAGEGKSTTSIAVAQGFAKLGKRVVLVDGDLRRPSLAKRFAQTPDHGLSDLLIGQADVADVAAPAADGLWLVAAGPLPPNPTDLLSGGRLPELMRTLEGEYDLVIVDGPPVLGLADAPMLGANTAAVLFVIEANRGLRGRTRAAIRRLRLNGATMLGALLTKFDAKRAGVDQYYGYDYYAYGESKSGK